MGIESEKIAKRLHGDAGAGDGIVFRNCILEKNLQGFPGAAAQIGKKLPIVEKVTAEDFGEDKDEMMVRNLLDDIRAEPFPEFHHAFLMAGRTEMTVLAREGQKIFMAAILAFHTRAKPLCRSPQSR